MPRTSKINELYLSYLDVLDDEDRNFEGQQEFPLDALRLAYAEARLQRDEEYKKTSNEEARSKAEAAVTTAEREFRLSLFSRLHSRKRSALCFSGGGIRSATFGLGILQALAACSQRDVGIRPKLLGEFDYLSTVSGGGYLGAWLSSWATRLSKSHTDKSNGSITSINHDGMARVIEELSRTPETGFEPEPVEVHHLREYSNYLVPKTGLLSADTWAIAATVARNMFLNWLVLIPLFAAILLIPVLAWRLLWLRPDRVEPSALWFLVSTGAVLGAFSIAYVGYNLPDAGNARKPAGTFLWLCLLPLALSAVQLNVFWAWLPHGNPQAPWWDLVSLGKSGLHWWHLAVLGSAMHGGGVLAGLAYAVFKFRRPSGRTTVVAIIAAALTGFVGGATASALTGVVPLSITGHLLHPKAYAVLGFPAVIGVFLFAQTLLVGLSSYITEDEDREWWARAGGWLVAIGTGWAVFACVVLYSVQGLDWANAKLSATFTAVTGLAGWTAARAGKSPETGSSRDSEASRKLLTSNFVKEYGARCLLAIFLILLTMLLGALDIYVVRLMKSAPDLVPSLWPSALRPMGNITAHALWVVIGELAVCLIASYFININKFSLHGMYRMRLIRAYLGASNLCRNPNPFTGFDENDNIPMCELAKCKPLHVVNITLNLVHGTNLAWQQRKAESFTSTRLHTGSCRVGYRSSATYGGRYKRVGHKTPISLGTAITISGAAASPNMGYHSSPLLTLVMTLFNARLGCWLGNPKSSSDVWQKPGPTLGIRGFIDETLGFTDDSNNWLYLSDGGHFENLGLYEMVLRRCHLIVVSDAGADPKYSYEDLANAIRKIRVDLGISIEFPNPTLPMSPAHKPSEEFPGHHCAIGRIRYSAVDEGEDDGVLIYIKPSLNGNETPDIRYYATIEKTFPHQTTTDQFYDEAQFESYCRLGVHVIEEICREKFYDPKGLTLDEFVTAAGSYCDRPVGVRRKIPTPEARL